MTSVSLHPKVSTVADLLVAQLTLSPAITLCGIYMSH